MKNNAKLGTILLGTFAASSAHADVPLPPKLSSPTNTVSNALQSAQNGLDFHAHHLQTLRITSDNLAKKDDAHFDKLDKDLQDREITIKNYYATERKLAETYLTALEKQRLAVLAIGRAKLASQKTDALARIAREKINVDAAYTTLTKHREAFSALDTHYDAANAIPSAPSTQLQDGLAKLQADRARAAQEQQKRVLETAKDITATLITEHNDIMSDWNMIAKWAARKWAEQRVEARRVSASALEARGKVLPKAAASASQSGNSASTAP